MMAILFPSFCFSQVKGKYSNSYEGVGELHVVKEIKAAELFGIYQIYNGFAGLDLQLDSTSNYMLLAYDCTERDMATKGRWIFNKGQIIAKEPMNESFEIARFGSYLLLIPASSKAAILTRFKQELKVYLDDKTLTNQEADFLTRRIFRKKIDNRAPNITFLKPRLNTNN